MSAAKHLLILMEGKKKKKRLSTCDQFSIMIRSKAQLRVIIFFPLSPEIQAACLSKEQLTHLPQWQRTFPFRVQHKHEPRWVCDMKGKYKQLIPPPPQSDHYLRGKVTQPGERRKAWLTGLCGGGKGRGVKRAKVPSFEFYLQRCVPVTGTWHL